MPVSAISRRLQWFLIRTPWRGWAKARLAAASAKEVAQRKAAFAKIDLEPEQEKVIASLRKHGFADATALLDRSLLEDASATLPAKIGRTADRGNQSKLNEDKTFWDHLLDEDADAEGRQSSSSPFVQIASSEQILAIVASYFEDAPLLDYVHLVHSRHSPGPFKVSQMWHRDYDDEKLLKLFVYFTDCETAEDGPFTFVPAEESSAVGFTLRSHLTDEEFSAASGGAQPKMMKGPRFSAFFVDTGRCFHMGSRVSEGHERILYIATFTTFPKFNRRPSTFFRVDDAVSERQKVALTYG